MIKVLTLSIILLLLDDLKAQVCIATSCPSGCCQDPVTCAPSFSQCVNTCNADVNCNGKCCINNTCQVCPSSGFMVPQALVYILIVALAVLTIGVCSYAIYKDRKKKNLKRFRNLIGQGQIVTRGPKIDTVSFPSTADTSLVVEDLEKKMIHIGGPKHVPNRMRFKSGVGLNFTKNNPSFDMNKEPEHLEDYNPYTGQERIPNEEVGHGHEIPLEDEGPVTE